jgi:hypothetical protein
MVQEANDETKVRDAAYKLAASAKSEQEFRFRCGTYLGKVFPFMPDGELKGLIEELALPIYRSTNSRPVSLQELDKRVRHLEEQLSVLSAKLPSSE